MSSIFGRFPKEARCRFLMNVLDTLLKLWPLRSIYDVVDAIAYTEHMVW